MATFFGEVVSVFSRAVEEDELENEDGNEEDEEIRRELEEKRKVHLKWSPEVCLSFEASGDKKIACSHLIITVGTNAAGFASAFLLNPSSWQAIGWLTQWNERNRGVDASPSAVGQPACVIYQQRESQSVLVCQCSTYVAEDQLLQWTEKLFSCLQRSGLAVTVLSDAPMVEYRTADYVSGVDVPFLRALKTSTYRNAVKCPLLEQPNIVTGLPAAVLSYCEVFGIPAVLYQNYSDITSADSLTMEAYKTALTVSKDIKLECPNKGMLQKVTRGGDIHGNLYT